MLIINLVESKREHVVLRYWLIRSPRDNGLTAAQPASQHTMLLRWASRHTLGCVMQPDASSHTVRVSAGWTMHASQSYVLSMP